MYAICVCEDTQKCSVEKVCFEFTLIQNNKRECETDFMRGNSAQETKLLSFIFVNDLM